MSSMGEKRDGTGVTVIKGEKLKKSLKGIIA